MILYFGSCLFFAELQELLPGIISQLGTDNVQSLRALLSQLQSTAGAPAAGADDDDIPDLVDNVKA